MNPLAILVAVLAVSIPTPPAVAQSYPAKPIRMIVPVPPGGSSDIVNRLSAGGAYVVGSSPLEMGKLLSAEKERWAKLIKDTGFKLGN